MTTHTPTIAVIGAGNMGHALIGGLLAKNHPPQNLLACDPSLEKLEDIKQKFSIQTFSHNDTAIPQADVIIFAVKPQVMSSVAIAAAKLIQTKKPLIISIAAGIRESNLQQWLGGELAIVRCMPNTPALIGCGASALFANSYTNTSQRDLAEFILGCVGITVWLEDEKQMDAVTALSGSGPAYFFLFMEALQNTGHDLGLPLETARLLTLQTAYGAARLALESHETITELRHHVTSPGGTTEAALEILEKAAPLQKLIAKALQAAQKRSEELGK
jgi:pyrroline-5-carboxylate reductase